MKHTIFFFFKILFIHERHTQKKAETQAEGDAGSMQGARRGTQPRDSRITPWAEGGAKPMSHLGCPDTGFRMQLFLKKTSYFKIT